METHTFPPTFYPNLLFRKDSTEAGLGKVTEDEPGIAQQGSQAGSEVVRNPPEEPQQQGGLVAQEDCAEAIPLPCFSIGKLYLRSEFKGSRDLHMGVGYRLLIQLLPHVGSFLTDIHKVASDRACSSIQRRLPVKHQRCVPHFSTPHIIGRACLQEGGVRGGDHKP